MNSIPMTTMAAAAKVTATSATMAHDGGEMESIDSTITTSTSTSTSSLSHLTNPAISNLTTNMVTASTNITAIAKEFQTPNSIRKARHGLLPIVNTPTPPSRFRPIPNPFESNINNLHLPTIDR